MSTISNAIAQAAATVRMVQVAQGSHEVQRFDARRNAWIASNPTDYHRARAALSEARVCAAAMAMGWDAYDADAAGHLYANRGGDWRAYVRGMAR
jgi:hypothetical protein